MKQSCMLRLPYRAGEIVPLEVSRLLPAAQQCVCCKICNSSFCWSSEKVPYPGPVEIAIACLIFLARLPELSRGKRDKHSRPSRLPKVYKTVYKSSVYKNPKEEALRNSLSRKAL